MILYANCPSLVVRSPGVDVISIPYGDPFFFAFSDAVENAGAAAVYTISLYGKNANSSKYSNGTVAPRPAPSAKAGVRAPGKVEIKFLFIGFCRVSAVFGTLTCLPSLPIRESILR